MIRKRFKSINIKLDSGGEISRKVTTRLETIPEAEARINREKRELDNQKNATSLECDICHKHICMTVEFDLNGSSFYHDDCITKQIKQHEISNT